MRAERDSEAKVSDLTHSTIVAVSKKSAQRQIVGLMTLALVAAKAYGVNQSQEACAEFLQSHGKDLGDMEADESTIDKYFGKENMHCLSLIMP